MESSTWNLESTAWNPESNTVLDSRTSGLNYLLNFSLDHLRCAYINVALASFGGQCVGASLNDNFCRRVIDGNAEAGTNSYEWWHDGNGVVGSWVQINFTRKFVINTIRVKQRPYAAEQSKGLKLTFMDGSEEYVSDTEYFLTVIVML